MPQTSHTSNTIKIGAAYIRVSTDEQTELSPDAQIRLILDTAKQDGYVISPDFIFVEKRGVSGRRADNRQEFQRMIATAKTQPCPFKRLYLWKFSRFARNQEESTFYKGILRKKCGVDIKSISEPIAEGMFGRLIETIIEWFDEYYSINLSGEVLRGMTEKALREGYQSAPCLGYRAVGEGKPYVIDEQEYAVVEFIFQSYHSGKDMTAIARTANEKGYRTKHNNYFDRRSIQRILSNPFYTGTVLWKDIQFQGSHETRRSITDIFEENQQRMRREYRPISRREASSCRHWLSGLLTCSVCGASLSYNRSSNPQKCPDFFQCWKYSKGIHPSSCSVSVKKAEQAVFDSLSSVLQAENLSYEYIVQKNQETAEIEKENALKEALHRIQIKEARIRAAYEDGIDTLEEYKANKTRLLNERNNILLELETLQNGDTRTEKPNIKDILKNIENIRDLVADPSVQNDVKGNAIRRIIKNIVFDREHDTFHVTYYIQ